MTPTIPSSRPNPTIDNADPPRTRHPIQDPHSASRTDAPDQAAGRTAPA
jgi:hypothetical protein